MGYRCSTCGALHDDVPLCFIAPAPWVVDVIPAAERARRVELGEEQCIVDGEHFFVRANLDLPIIGHHETVRWTVWSSLSLANFERTCELWTTPGRESEPPYFGWLSTALPGYPDTRTLQVQVCTEPVGIRPRLVLAVQDHPLARDQADGISWSRAMELSKAALGKA